MNISHISFRNGWLLVSILFLFVMPGCVNNSDSSDNSEEILKQIDILNSQIGNISHNMSSLNTEIKTLNEKVKVLEKKALRGEKTIGEYILTGDDLCTINGKPAVYFFSTTTCPHCKWEKPIISGVAEKFEGFITYRSWELDKQEHPQEDYDLFKKYNSKGSVPTIVLGCEYYRIGSGESIGEEAEIEALTQLFCDLTDNEPESVCSG